MATLRDIAQAAGVSPATASRALGSSPSVRPETRQRVRHAAQELGYQANALARGLRTQRTETIGLLLPDVRNPFFTELAYYVDKAAAAHGLTVMIGSADEQPEQQDRYLETLRRHQVDGIIAVPQGEPSAVLRSICAQIPTIFLDRDPGLSGVACVSSDNTAAICQLVDHVVGLGWWRFGVVAGPQTTSTGRARLAAVEQRLAHHGVVLDAADVVAGDFQLDSGVKASQELLAHGSYDAIIAADNMMALGTLMTLRRQGLVVGRDVALACVDDLEWFALVEPPITVVAQDAETLGHEAVARLVRAIAGEEVSSVDVAMQLIVRRSCGEPVVGEGAGAQEESHG